MEMAKGQIEDAVEQIAEARQASDDIHYYL